MNRAFVKVKRDDSQQKRVVSFFSKNGNGEMKRGFSERLNA